MTGERLRNNFKGEAAKPDGGASPDPGMIEFARTYGEWAADRDYDRLLSEGKQPCDCDDRED